MSLDVLINFFLIKKTECKGHLQKNIILYLIVTAQPNLNLPWDARNLHQHFITAHPTLTKYFGLLVTAQPNLNMPWDASNHQYFVTAHPTPTQYFRCSIGRGKLRLP